MENIINKINKLKKDKNAIILAHNYQPLEIQDIADITGDSLQLAKAAKSFDAEIIIVCGVIFMAESAKILNKDTKVLIPAKDAICGMARMINPEDILKMKEQHPGAIVITYVNSTAEVKAVSDICCTSSNAVDIVKQIPDNTPVIFGPDRNLAIWAKHVTGKNILPWDGYCCVHNDIEMEHLENVKRAYPRAKTLIHPECKLELLLKADNVSSTSGMIEYAANAPEGSEMIIGTEIGLVNRLIRDYPRKKIMPMKDSAICNPMKLIEPVDILSCLEKEEHEVILEDQVIEKAKKALEKMIEMSK